MSSFWSDNPELYDDLIIKEMIRRNLATEDEEPEVVLKRWNEREDSYTIAEEAEVGYMADRIDDAWERHKEKQMWVDRNREMHLRRDNSK